MYDFILYDTSNYIDFPIGGQLTSVHNFLLYLSQYQKEYCKRILLVGVTTNKESLGNVVRLEIGEQEFAFLSVVYRSTNLKDIQSSLRLAFCKGLIKYHNLIKGNKNTIHYIHTPEAFLPIRFYHPNAKTIVFSHGSFINMEEGFRFYQTNKFVKKMTIIYIQWLLQKATKLFVLDDKTYEEYKKYNENVVKVDNSILLLDKKINRNNTHHPLRLLYVGRLSKIKGINNIILAINQCYDVSLQIVGDGEERDTLLSLIKSEQIQFLGPLRPDKVNEILQSSDALILNSKQEGKPMVILEAMSMGLPIITTNVGGIAEMVSFGENAIQTDGSIEQIIDAIDMLKKNYRQYSKKSYELSKQYDYRLVNKKIWDEILGEKQ